MKVIGWASFVAALCLLPVGFVVAFLHPELTDTQRFLRFWYLYAPQGGLAMTALLILLKPR